MSGAIVTKPGGTGSGASTFAQLGGDPNDNAALAAFVASKVATAVPATGNSDVDGGTAAATGSGNIDGGNAQGI